MMTRGLLSRGTYTRLPDMDVERDPTSSSTEEIFEEKKKTMTTRTKLLLLSRRGGVRLLFVTIAISSVVVILVVFLRPSHNAPESDDRKSPLAPPGPPRLQFSASTFNWSTVPERNPVSSVRPLPTEQPLALPAVQHVFGPGHRDGEETQRRRDAVREAFLRCWRSYKERAWMRDELTPVSGGARDTFGGWAATLVDALDTLWIMDLRDEFYEAAAAAGSLDWANTSSTALNTFETTIRHLGGLLSAHDLSGEPALLSKAVELGEMLYHAFDTPNRMPPFWLDFANARSGRLVADSGTASAVPASLSLEFTRLSQLTGEPKYFDAVSRVTDFLEISQNKSRLPGMWPKIIDFRSMTLSDGTFTLGGEADSLYEYLPKMHALLGGLEPRYERMYRDAMDTARKYLLFRTMLPDSDLSKTILFAGDASVNPGRNDGSTGLNPMVQHLSCFAGGMFGLGGKLVQLPDHIKIGEQITRGCVWAYSSTTTGIMPEIFSVIACPWSANLDTCEWDESRWERDGDKRLAKGHASIQNSQYILRPEAIESVFIMYRITGDEGWRDMAWTMFESIMAATRTEFGNSAIEDVAVGSAGETRKKDEMEVSRAFVLCPLPFGGGGCDWSRSLTGHWLMVAQSFWLAETLKYFYLVFSPPELISLDEFVFNTEAHPLRRPKPLG